MSNLQMSLIGKWFEMTKEGIKTEDYRELSAYWCKRFLKKVNIVPDLNFDWQDVEDFFHYKNDMSEIEWYLKHEDLEFKQFDFNIMTLGYPKSTDISRILKLEHKGIEIGYGKQDWGAEPNKLYFIIKHGEIIK